MSRLTHESHMVSQIQLRLLRIQVSWHICWSWSPTHGTCKDAHVENHLSQINCTVSCHASCWRCLWHSLDQQIKYKHGSSKHLKCSSCTSQILSSLLCVKDIQTKFFNFLSICTIYMHLQNFKTNNSLYAWEWTSSLSSLTTHGCT